MNTASKTRKSLIACLGALAVATLAAVGLALYARLDQPLFFKSYLSYDERLPQFSPHPFQLRYLANTDDTRVVDGVEFEGVPQELFAVYATESAWVRFAPGFELSGAAAQYTDVRSVGCYSVHTVSVTIQPHAPADTRRELILNSAVVHFSDGTTQRVSLGEVRLRYGPEQGEPPLSQEQSSGSSDGTASSVLRSRGDFTVAGLRWSPAVPADQLPVCTLNGVDPVAEGVGALQLKNGDMLEVNSRLNLPLAAADRFATYHLQAIVSLRDAGGNEREAAAHSMFYREQPRGFWELLRVAAAMRAEQEVQP